MWKKKKKKKNKNKKLNYTASPFQQQKRYVRKYNFKVN